jgi:two-component sensor histidine kinase
VRRKDLPTEEGWQSWMLHPVTEAFQIMLDLKIKEIRDRWEAEEFLAETAERTAALNLTALSLVKTLKQLRDLDYEDLIESLIEDEEDGDSESKADM